MFDEVQSGIGRTGRPFAAETFGVTPDVILFAKGVASGLPLGGLIASRATFDRWPPGTHGTTFGGNPVCCAAALATLDVLDGRGLCERAAVAGRAPRSIVSAQPPPGSPAVLEVRGVGLMIGVELADGADRRGRAAALPRRRRDRAHVRPGRERAAPDPAADDHG